MAGPATDRIEVTQRYYTYILLAAAVAAVAAAGLAVAVPGRGAGLAPLAVPVATAVTMAGFIGLNTALGGDLRPSFVVGVLRAPLAPALLAAMLVLALGAAAPAARLEPARTSGRAMTIAAVAILVAAGAAAGTVVAARDTLVPIEPVRILEGTSSGTTTSEPQVALYRDEIAPSIAAINTAIEAEVRTIDADPSLDDTGRAAALRATVLPELRDLHGVAQAVPSDAPAVRAANARCLEALENAIAAFEAFATAYENGDAQAFAQAQQLLLLHTGQWRAWQAAVRAL